MPDGAGRSAGVLSLLHLYVHVRRIGLRSALRTKHGVFTMKHFLKYGAIAIGVVLAIFIGTAAFGLTIIGVFMLLSKL